MLKARIGFEFELLAPRGSSRRHLAEAMAEGFGGTVHAAFHIDAEPSKVEGMDVFHHLTPAFEVVDADGCSRCTIVDDVTIVDQLDPNMAPEAGWYRIVSDDLRILRIASHHIDGDAPLGSCLVPLAGLFGARLDGIGDYVRMSDDSGATIVIAAPLPGERHRPSEVVTPPIDENHAQVLEELLAPACRLGFLPPTEAAVHAHFDAPPLRDPMVIRNLVRLVQPRQDLLRWMVGTNPHCRRLGPLPAGLAELVEEDVFLDHGWDHARRLMIALKPSKYADLNLRNVVAPPPGKDTVEWRILPGTLDVARVIAGVTLFEAILDRARADPPPERVNSPVTPSLRTASALLAEVGL